ncbi:protein of unknown function [Burkholderia multivorans]
MDQPERRAAPKDKKKAPSRRFSVDFFRCPTHHRYGWRVDMEAVWRRHRKTRFRIENRPPPPDAAPPVDDKTCWSASLPACDGRSTMVGPVVHAAIAQPARHARAGNANPALFFLLPRRT